MEVKEASPVNAVRSYPDDKSIEENKNNIEKLYQKMKRFDIMFTVSSRTTN